MTSGLLEWERQGGRECHKNVHMQEKCYNQRQGTITQFFEPTSPLQPARVLMSIPSLCADRQAGIHNVLIQTVFGEFRKKRIVNE